MFSILNKRKIYRKNFFRKIVKPNNRQNLYRKFSNKPIFEDMLFLPKQRISGFPTLAKWFVGLSIPFLVLPYFFKRSYMKKIRERNKLKEEAFKGMKGSERANIMFGDNFGLYDLISGKMEIFEKLGFFDEKLENRVEYNYVVFFKGSFGPFFDMYSRVGQAMKWEPSNTKINFQGKNENFQNQSENFNKVLWVYIADEERTKNLLLNVMKIGETDQSKNSI